MEIRPFSAEDEPWVVALWEQCRLTRPWNDPHKDIARKLAVQPELFLVGVEGGAVVATVVAGYEGHRGWVNYLAVAPAFRGRGFARALMERVEQLLLARGCPKVSLLVRASNAEAIAFYRHLGYLQDESVAMGKRLVHDDIERFVARRFKPADRDAALALCRSATIHDGSAAEPRLIRCALVAAEGSLESLRRYIEDLKIDYREVVIAGEYASKDGALVRVRDLGASFGGED